MANIQNLKPYTTLSSDEAVKRGRAGGIKSGEVRREKSSMKKLLQQMLNETATNDGKTYREIATLGLIKGAIKGDSRNYKVILETLGELGNASEIRQQEELSKLDTILIEIKNEANK